jgi:hypothetical protein
MTPINSSELKQALLDEWDMWIRTQPLEGDATDRDGLKFFLERRAKPSRALPKWFSNDPNQWQVIQAWLQDEKRID